MINFQSFWRHRRWVNWLLLPLSICFGGIIFLRRLAYRYHFFKTPRFSIPIIIVGNIVVGGGGKTPLVIAIVKALKKLGYHPGIISRGYLSSKKNTPYLVKENDSWQQCGDEPLLLHRKTGAPICICHHRVNAATHLQKLGCDILVSDDGLQHYALHRDIEICVLKADYKHGNGWLLPAGPLREKISRIKNCHFVLCMGEPHKQDSTFLPLTMCIDGFYPINAPERRYDVSFFIGKKVTAVAGIAHPNVFFNQLEKIGITLTNSIALPDHKRLSQEKINQLNTDILITTEKDAVKYPDADERFFVTSTRCVLPPSLLSDITHHLKTIK